MKNTELLRAAMPLRSCRDGLQFPYYIGRNTAEAALQYWSDLLRLLLAPSPAMMYIQCYQQTQKDTIRIVG